MVLVAEELVPSLPKDLGAPRDKSRAFCEISNPRVRRASKCLERETGIEPATNSLEGCDSTTELLPPAATQITATPSTPESTKPSNRQR
jgi:hypothetical protein